MIYTIGMEDAYRRCYEIEGTLFAVGRKQGFRGTAVWRNTVAAHHAIQRLALVGYRVFEVKADWETDTLEIPEGRSGRYRVLVRNADITIPSEWKNICQKREGSDVYKEITDEPHENTNP